MLALKRLRKQVGRRESNVSPLDGSKNGLTMLVSQGWKVDDDIEIEIRLTGECRSIEDPTT